MTDNVSKILDERKKTHGDFTDHARITRNLKLVMQNEIGWGRLVAVQAEALDMIVHKIGRILAGNPNECDHWFDIAGYATLVADRCAIPKAAMPKAPSNKDAVYCVACDRHMHVNAAGYVICEHPACPNIGKKVT